MAAVLSSRDVFVVRRAGEGKSVALTGVLSVRTETAQGVRQPSVSIVFGPLLGLAREQVDRLNASIDGTQLVVTSSGREHPVALAVVVCVQLTVDAVRMLRGLQMVIGRPCIVLSGPMIPSVSLGGLRSHFVPPSVPHGPQRPQRARTRDPLKWAPAPWFEPVLRGAPLYIFCG